MGNSYYIKKFIGIQRKNLCVMKLLGKLKAGTRVAFGKKVDITVRKKGKIEMGQHSSLAPYSSIATVGGVVTIGSFTSINCYADIVCHKKITIGDNCAIAPRVVIYDHDHKFGANGLEKGFNCTEISIGNNCWIGTNVIILRGATIGNNCVIGAGCVVKGNIPDNTIVTQSRELVLKPLV